MLEELRYRDKIKQPIQVGIIGTGRMATGIAWQIARTPGMELSFIAGRRLEAAQQVQSKLPKPTRLFDDPNKALDDASIPIDVVVEAITSVEASAQYCLKAIKRQAHVVLMNAEVDLLLGPYLQHQAKQHGVIVTSDAGDQHGVLMRLIEEIVLWNFDIVQAGNVKGFLDRHALLADKRAIAEQYQLNPNQCLAFTDGTKLNIEMALIGNGTNLTPIKPGMQGPRVDDIHNIFNVFDFDTYQGEGHVDYLIGAQPGGGVYVVGRCDDAMQQQYLDYYKVVRQGEYHLFYRPYHLCHIETPRAVAMAALWNKAVLTPRFGRVNDVYAYAKQDLAVGSYIENGIGDDAAYGLVRQAEPADQDQCVPICLLCSDQGKAKPRMRRAVAKDEPIRYTDVDLPDNDLVRLHQAQAKLLKETQKEMA